MVGETLLAYHTVVEDVLDPGTVNPGDDAEIHVADTNTGGVSFVLIAEPDGMMEAFRSKALALADTFEIVATGETTDEEC